MVYRSLNSAWPGNRTMQKKELPSFQAWRAKNYTPDLKFTTRSWVWEASQWAPFSLSWKSLLAETSRGPWSSGQLHCNLFLRWQRTESTNRARLETSGGGAGRSQCCWESELGLATSLLDSPQSGRTSEAYNCNFKPQKKTGPSQTFILLRKRVT